MTTAIIFTLFSCYICKTKESDLLQAMDKGENFASFFLLWLVSKKFSLVETKAIKLALNDSA